MDDDATVLLHVRKDYQWLVPPEERPEGWEDFEDCREGFMIKPRLVQ